MVVTMPIMIPAQIPYNSTKIEIDEAYELI